MSEDWESKFLQRWDAALAMLKSARAIDPALPIRPVAGPFEAYFWVRLERWAADGKGDWSRYEKSSRQPKPEELVRAIAPQAIDILENRQPQQIDIFAA
jgi:hypothetical protein